MVITKAIRDRLRADAGVLAILVKPKVYMRRAPAQASFPYVLVSVASVSFPARSNAERSAGATLIVEAKVQIDCFHSDKISVTAEEDVDRLAEAVADSLDDMKGTVQGVTVGRALQDDERDNYERLQDGSDNGIHRITQDYKVKFQQPL